MAFKRFKELKPFNWAFVKKLKDLSENEDFKKGDSLVTNAKEFPDEINVIDITSHKNSKIRRIYCTCGNVSSGDDEVPSVCPACGNNKAIVINSYNPGAILLGTVYHYDYDNTFDTMNLSVESVGVQINPKTDEYEFFLENNKVATITNNSLNMFRSLAGFDYERAVTPLSGNLLEVTKNWKGNNAKSKKRYRSVYNDRKSFTNLDSFFEAKEDYPNLMKDIDNYPAIVNLSIALGLSILSKTVTVEDILDNVIKCPTKYRPIIDDLFKRDEVYAFYSTGSSIDDNFQIFKNLDIIKTPELTQAIDYIVKHGKFSAAAIRSFLKSIAKYDYPEELEKILAKHILSNYIIEGTSVICNFDRKLQLLKTWGYPISEESLDKRNYNLIANMKKLETLGYNPDRVTLFANAFDVNPVESLKYLDSKRAPRKALKVEVENMVNEKYS